MPAVTTIALGASAVAGGAKAIFGASQAKRARNAINNYQRQDLTNSNVFKNIGVSTLGSDYLREESARTTSGIVDVLRAGGIRGVLGGLPGVVAQNRTMNREGQNYLDNQVIKRDYAIAQDDARIRSMIEQREYQDLAGLGAQLNAGQQNMWNGIGDVTSAFSSFANTAEAFGGKTPQVSSVNAGIQPTGIQSVGSGFTAPLLLKN